MAAYRGGGRRHGAASSRDRRSSRIKPSIVLSVALGAAAAGFGLTTAPAPAQGQQPAQMYVAPETHTGLTFEANIGFGMLRAAPDNGDADTQSALGGLNLGLGGFINPKLALTVRIAGATHAEDGVRITQAFFGPSLQYWPNANTWVGGGVGFGIAALSFDGNDASYTEKGLGLDLRAGYTFNPYSKHSFNASVEVTPAFLDGGTFSGIALLIGYQTL